MAASQQLLLSTLAGITLEELNSESLTDEHMILQLKTLRHEICCELDKRFRKNVEQMVDGFAEVNALAILGFRKKNPEDASSDREIEARLLAEVYASSPSEFMMKANSEQIGDRLTSNNENRLGAFELTGQNLFKHSAQLTGETLQLQQAALLINQINSVLSISNNLQCRLAELDDEQDKQLAFYSVAVASQIAIEDLKANIDAHRPPTLRLGSLESIVLSKSYDALSMQLMRLKASILDELTHVDEIVIATQADKLIESINDAVRVLCDYQDKKDKGYEDEDLSLMKPAIDACLKKVNVAIEKHAPIPRVHDERKSRFLLFKAAFLQTIEKDSSRQDLTKAPEATIVPK
jgi:hypothetical protein